MPCKNQIFSKVAKKNINSDYDFKKYAKEYFCGSILNKIDNWNPSMFLHIKEFTDIFHFPKKATADELISFINSKIMGLPTHVVWLKCTLWIAPNAAQNAHKWTLIEGQINLIKGISVVLLKAAAQGLIIIKKIFDLD